MNLLNKKPSKISYITLIAFSLAFGGNSKALIPQKIDETLTELNIKNQLITTSSSKDLLIQILNLSQTMETEPKKEILKITFDLNKENQKNASLFLDFSLKTLRHIFDETFKNTTNAYYQSITKNVDLTLIKTTENTSDKLNTVKTLTINCRDTLFTLFNDAMQLLKNENQKLKIISESLNALINEQEESNNDIKKANKFINSFQDNKIIGFLWYWFTNETINAIKQNLTTQIASSKNISDDLFTINDKHGIDLSQIEDFIDKKINEKIKSSEQKISKSVNKKLGYSAGMLMLTGTIIYSLAKYNQIKTPSQEGQQGFNTCAKKARDLCGASDDLSRLYCKSSSIEKNNRVYYPAHINNCSDLNTKSYQSNNANNNVNQLKK